MKVPFLRRSQQPLTRASARNAVLLNQLATPGLGSLFAGRFLAGSGQLLLAIAGFVMVVGWFVLVMINLVAQMQGAVQPKPVGWLGEAGAAVFGAAWLWSLLTSVGLLREALRLEHPPELPR